MKMVMVWMKLRMKVAGDEEVSYVHLEMVAASSSSTKAHTKVDCTHLKSVESHKLGEKERVQSAVPAAQEVGLCCM